MRIKVIGAGPSGSVAAISALRAGHEVEMHEEHERAGYPQHCSGLVSKEGLDSLLDIVDYRQFIINRISGAAFDFAGEKFEIRRKEETAYVINRAAFDAALAQKAEEEGAKIFYGKRLVHETCKTGNPERETIIGADGALSGTALHFNFPKIGKFAFGLKAKAELRAGEPRRVSLFYDNEKFPGLFGWIIPRSECEAEIGVGTTGQASLLSGFRFLLKRTGARLMEKPQGKIIPLEPRKKIAAAFGNTSVMLVGDAAGHVKSSSGGGVVFGTAGARLAGSFAGQPEKYERLWKAGNESDVRAHMLLQKFFSLQPNFALRLTALSSRLLGLDYILSLCGNMDRPTRSVSNALAKVFNIPPALRAPGEPVGTRRNA